MIPDIYVPGWGITFVCLCLMAGTLYQQAPRRDEARKAQQAEQAAAADLESSMSLLKK
jgi:hypothetical protein